MGNLLFNVQSEAFWKRGLQVPLTLLSHTQSEVEWRLGSRSARGCATELGLFLLPWHCRLAPSSICSFGTYSCNDYEQSLIKLQRTLPRNQCVSVYGDDHLLISFFCLWMSVCVCAHLHVFVVVCMHVCGWLVHHLTVSLTLLLVLLPLCHAEYQHVMQIWECECFSAGAYITVTKACVKEGMDDAAWIYFPPVVTFSVIYFVHKEFPYDG